MQAAEDSSPAQLFQWPAKYEEQTCYKLKNKNIKRQILTLWSELHPQVTLLEKCEYRWISTQNDITLKLQSFFSRVAFFFGGVIDQHCKAVIHCNIASSWPCPVISCSSLCKHDDSSACTSWLYTPPRQQQTTPLLTHTHMHTFCLKMMRITTPKSILTL